jgi:hypothetical protein
MPKAKKTPAKKSINWNGIPTIVGQLDSLLVAVDDDEDAEDIGYRLDALITDFIECGLVRKSKLRRLRFHAAIEAFAIHLPDRDSLAQEFETFEDLINAYGDEPSEEEMTEAKEILAKVVAALKNALRAEKSDNQLPLM